MANWQYGKSPVCNFSAIWKRNKVREPNIFCSWGYCLVHYTEQILPILQELFKTNMKTVIEAP
jgi:hypothetical protein